MTKKDEAPRRRKPAARSPRPKPSKDESPLEALLAAHAAPLWMAHSHCLLAAMGRDGKIAAANAALDALAPGGRAKGRALCALFVEPNHERLAALLARVFTPEGAAPEFQTFHAAGPDQQLPLSYKCGFLPLPRGRALFYAEPLPPLDARAAEEYFQVNSELAALTRDLQKTRNDLERRTRELEESRSRILELATTDELTGLPNRRTMQARLHDEVARATRYGAPLSILLFDLDDFKAVNDTHGHQVGDRVLRHAAGVLRDGVRACDTMGRFGGEEFLAILPQTGLDEALVAAERLRGALARKPCAIHFSLVLSVTASIGAATLRTSPGVAGAKAQGEPLDRLLERADKALYRAKKAGRNRVEAEEE